MSFKDAGSSSLLRRSVVNSPFFPLLEAAPVRFWTIPKLFAGTPALNLLHLTSRELCSQTVQRERKG